MARKIIASLTCVAEIFLDEGDIDVHNVIYAVSSITYKKFGTTGQNLLSWSTF